MGVHSPPSLRGGMDEQIEQGVSPMNKKNGGNWAFKGSEARSRKSGYSTRRRHGARMILRIINAIARLEGDLTQALEGVGLLKRTGPYLPVNSMRAIRSMWHLQI